MNHMGGNGRENSHVEMLSLLPRNYVLWVVAAAVGAANDQTPVGSQYLTEAYVICS